MNIQEYIKAVDEQYQTGIAREHSYRPALQQLLASMLPDYVVTNEPAHFECGAPDYIISQKKGSEQPVFFIEAKDLYDTDLDGMRQHKEQFNRYKSSLDYIIFTDYLDFHVYEHGNLTQKVRIGELQGSHIKMVKEAEQEFVAVISHLATAKPAPITSATRLAQQMASKARLLADVITKAFENAENEHSYDNSQMESQLQAFKDVLINDLTPKRFADIYAQTIAYGMFAARLHDETPEDFSRQEAATLIPKTNPFLRQIFQQIAGYDLDERIAWIVDDLAQTFRATDVEKIMGIYGNNALHSDPMIHFYEEFLSAYDPTLRKSMGVWYTPQPVVRFIVRAVDDILQRDFHLPMGLADNSKAKHEVKNDYYDGTKKTQKTIACERHRVQILDPATGTGTFLAEVVRQIYQKFQGMEGMWQGYVEEHLLPRLHGFELLMASYAVAHLKLDMQLRGLGYDSAKARNQRMRIYLTNSLEECHPDTGTLWANWLSTEATEANHIKRDCPVMVMVGNPPYSGVSQNNGEWITNLINDYKKEPGGIQKLKERKTWLNDDYVKFIRLAQDYVERNGKGVVGFINNNGFLDNPTFRGMRWNLLKTFDKIYVVNLHGNSMKKETAPGGSKDENVFDITVGVSINIFVKTGEKVDNELGRVYYKDVYGKRENKYEELTKETLDSFGFEEVVTHEPYYQFCKIEEEGREDYERGVSIAELMPVNVTGLVTMGDSFAIAENRELLSKNLHEFLTLSISSSELKQKYGLGKNYADFILESKNKGLIEDEKKYTHILYRPFDIRCTYFDSKVLWRTREKVNNHLMKPNISLIVSRQAVTDNWSHVLVTPYICDNRTFYSNKGITQACPLYLYTTTIDGTEEKVPNLNKEEWAKFDAAVGRETTPEELLYYIYGVLHTPFYRERYKEFLKIDFPRIPLPENEEEFVRKGAIGRQLIDLHLMRNTHTWQLTTTFPEAGDCMVEAISYKDGRVMINATQYFGNVPEEAWNAYIGGYQPAQKWLKDRKGRQLSYDDIRHYLCIVHALSETQRIMNEME